MNVEKTAEANSALERSKLRLAQMKANPKQPNKQGDNGHARDTSFIWRKPADTEPGAGSGPLLTGRAERPLPRKSYTELEKKYNPVAVTNAK